MAGEAKVSNYPSPQPKYSAKVSVKLCYASPPFCRWIILVLQLQALYSCMESTWKWSKTQPVVSTNQTRVYHGELCLWAHKPALCVQYVRVKCPLYVKYVRVKCPLYVTVGWQATFASKTSHLWRFLWACQDDQHLYALRTKCVQRYIGCVLICTFWWSLLLIDHGSFVSSQGAWCFHVV